MISTKPKMCRGVFFMFQRHHFGL